MKLQTICDFEVFCSWKKNHLNRAINKAKPVNNKVWTWWRQFNCFVEKTKWHKLCIVWMKKKKKEQSCIERREWFGTSNAHLNWNIWLMTTENSAEIVKYEHHATIKNIWFILPTDPLAYMIFFFFLLFTWQFRWLILVRWFQQQQKNYVQI